MESRLNYHCQSCSKIGNRSESDVAGTSDDKCPACGGNDIDVYDPRYSGPGRSEEMN